MTRAPGDGGVVGRSQADWGSRFAMRGQRAVQQEQCQCASVPEGVRGGRILEGAVRWGGFDGVPGVRGL